MSKFTPGPWHVVNGVQIRNARDQIAKVWMMRSGEGTRNAHLIAAAPDLFRELERLVERVEAIVLPDQSTPDTSGAREALAKANGEGS